MSFRIPSQKRLRNHGLKLLMLFFVLSWSGPSQAASCMATVDPLRMVLHEIEATAESPVREQPVSSDSARTVLRKHLDAGLLANALKAEGVSFTFVLPGQQVESNLEVLMLSYGAEETAADMQRRLAGKGDHFKNTIILTRFSSVSIGSHLLVIFTEKSGNETLVKLVDQLPEILKARR